MKDALGYYKVLEVDSSTDEKTLKIKYRDLAKLWHPDFNKAENAMEHFQKLSVAYDVLKDKNSRLIYDLLSEVYTSDNFPDMQNLSVLKDKYNKENPLVRVIFLRKIIGKITRYNVSEDRLVCTYEQARQEALAYSLSNWFLGWWHPKALVKNVRALIDNFRNIGQNNQDNLLLLVHNAVAFEQDGKPRQAMVSALQAMEYADGEQRELLERFIKKLGISKPDKIPSWRLLPLKLVQLIVPFLILLSVLYPFAQQLSLVRYMQKENEVTYFQKVKFNGGGEIVDDVVVSKIFSIPVNVADDSKLYHFSQDTEIMYGPGEEFDVMANGQKDQTVRITGFTLDKSWYRVMLDSGEMGFVPDKILRRGAKTPPLDGSKIVPNI
ncbi:MAG: J domain-containing protein [Azospirillum sp.]|nr:J domain-containing protein [Azospirillum sp.]